MAAPLGGSIAVNSFVDSAGPNQPFFAPASGGGGGGGGPNPVVSTLTVASGNTFIQLNNGDSTSLNATLVFPFNSANTDKTQIGVEQFTSTLSVLYDGGFGALQMNQLVLNSEQQGAPAPGCSLQTSQFGDLIVNIPPGASIRADDRNLSISTINGAPPGAAVPPNLVVSTIQSQSIGNDDVVFVGANGNIIFDQNSSGNGIQFDGTTNAEIRNNGGVFRIGGYIGQPDIPVSISTLTVSTINGATPGGGGGGPPPAIVSTISSLVNVSTINYGSPGLLNIAGGVQVSDFLGAGTISTLRLDSIVPGGSVAIPLAVLSTVGGPVSMSTLTVSSINGASYPPPAGGMVFSSINIPGGPGSAFNADPNVLTNVLTIPIIPNHVYSIDVNARVIANAPTVAITDNYYLELVANGGSTVALDTAWGVQISSLTSGSIFTEVGGSGILKAPANPVSTLLLNILGSFSTTTRVDSFSYIDFGPI